MTVFTSSVHGKYSCGNIVYNPIYALTTQSILFNKLKKCLECQTNQHNVDKKKSRCAKNVKLWRLEATTLGEKERIYISAWRRFSPVIALQFRIIQWCVVILSNCKTLIKKLYIFYVFSKTYVALKIAKVRHQYNLF